MGIGFDLTGIFGGDAEKAAEFCKDARSLHSRIWLSAGRRIFAGMYFPDASKGEDKRPGGEKGGGGDGRSL